jgi:L-threonylcarbamoyladenylate synthase
LSAAQVRHGKMIEMQVVGYPNHPEPSARMVAAALERGGVAVIPTDTVYGLVCLPSWPEAVQRVFALKRRPPELRLPVIVGSQADVDSLGVEFGDAATRATAAFWPGALTIVVGVGEPKVDWLAGRDEVAIRMPESDLVRSLTALVGPFLMTSANAHGGRTQSSLRVVLLDLAGEPDVVVDGGPLSVVSSTLVNFNLPEPAVEREGAVPTAAVMDVLRG